MNRQRQEGGRVVNSSAVRVGRCVNVLRKVVCGVPVVV